jgi:hypothetical protein
LPSLVSFCFSKELSFSVVELRQGRLSRQNCQRSSLAVAT